MNELRRHRPNRALHLGRRLAPHLTVLAMLVTFLPHCLFGCSMAMSAVAPSAVVAPVMECCAAACPMNHPDECLGAEEASDTPDAILQKSDPTIPTLVPAALAEASSPLAGAEARSCRIEGGPLPPPVPLHLLNSQFLI